MDDPHPSSDPEQSPDRADPERQPPDRRKPFVEPELRCETDLVDGTGDREFFETTMES